MHINAAPRELRTEVTKDHQVVGAHQDMHYVSSKSNTLDQQEDLVGPDPLADFLLRFSVTTLHTLSEQKFAASLHKEPVVLPIAFYAATYPFPVEPDLQRTSRGQGNGGQGWPTCFADTIAAMRV
jgi:hypothetical protein